MKSDVELDRAITDSEFSYRFRVNSDCEDFLREMQFNTLLAKWKERVAAKTDGAPTVGPVVAAGAAPLVKDDRFRLVTNEAEFNAVLSAIEKSGEFGFDLETTGLNPRSAEIVGVALCTDLSYGVYIPSFIPDPMRRAARAKACARGTQALFGKSEIQKNRPKLEI